MKLSSLERRYMKSAPQRAKELTDTQKRLLVLGIFAMLLVTLFTYPYSNKLDTQVAHAQETQMVHERVLGAEAQTRSTCLSWLASHPAI